MPQKKIVRVCWNAFSSLAFNERDAATLLSIDLALNVA
jgi:hypothetical protein